MADVKWIKMDVTLPDNRKIKRIRKLPGGNDIVLLWVFLLARAGESNQNGALFYTSDLPYTEEDLADDFDFTIDFVKIALMTLEKFKMIERFDQIIFIKNWEEYQELDKLQKIGIQNRKRQEKHREKQRLIANGNVTVTLPVTESNAVEEDKEQELDKELDKDKEFSLIEEYSEDPIPPSETYEEMFGIIENEFKRLLSVSESKKFTELFNAYGFKKIKYSLIEAIVYRKLSLNYMEACLDSWKQKGYTLEQLGQGIHKST